MIHQKLEMIVLVTVQMKVQVLMPAIPVPNAQLVQTKSQVIY
jgi:hypothetical protein